MSASDNGPDGRKEQHRRGVTFLRSARNLPELTPAQIDRIERHLNRAHPLRARRPILSPALAALVIVLVAGAALAVAGKSLARLPGIGPWIGALLTPAPARKSPANGHPRRAEGTAASAPSVAEAQAPTPAVAVAVRRAPPISVDRAPAISVEHAPVPAAQAAVAPSPPEMTAAPARPRRRQPETAVASTTAAPAGEHDSVPSARADATARAAASAPTPIEKTAPEATAATGPAPTPTLPPAAVSPAAAPLPPPPPLPVAAHGPGSPAATAPSPTVAPPPAVATESPIVAQSRSFAGALERWHREHDAKAALAALDAHERRFPAGEFRVEAQLLRAEIVLAGGHEREGLALLDPLALAGLPRARELRTVRGELRIKFGRCVEGKADLGAVLADRTDDALAQRARQALVDCP